MSLIINNIASEGYLSGNTLYSNFANITNLVVTNITGASTTDYYVTGGTYSSGTLTLGRNGLSDVVVTGFTTGGGGSGITNKVAYWVDSTILSANTNFHWDSTNQRLGIGTSSPSARLSVSTSGLTGGAFPATVGTSQTGEIVRLNNGGTNLVLDIGGFAANGNWLQSTNQTDLSLTFPLLLNPNGGNVGIGRTTPTQPLDVNGNIMAFLIGTQPNVIQRRSNGSVGSETNLSSDNIIGYNNWQAYQTTSTYPNVGRVGAVADNNHSSTSLPTRLSFWTTPSGSTTIQERMRINNQGNVAIGTDTYDGTNPERLLVSATTLNAIVGRGSIASYLQLNIQNRSNSTSASSDVVATNDTGSETNNYIDMGINSSTYSAGFIGTANDAYLYNVGRELYIGNTTPGSNGNLKFFAGNTATATTMTVSYDQKVGIGTVNPSEKLDVSGKTKTITLQVTSGATPGFVLKSSDDNGNAYWDPIRITNTATTTNATTTTLATINTIPDNATSYVEVFVKAYQSSATNWGVWKRTLTVTKVSNVVTIQEENADVDKQSSGLNATSVSFSGTSGNVLVRVTGIAATTIDWKSAHEIIL